MVARGWNGGVVAMRAPLERAYRVSPLFVPPDRAPSSHGSGQGSPHSLLSIRNPTARRPLLNKTGGATTRKGAAGCLFGTLKLPAGVTASNDSSPPITVRPTIQRTKNALHHTNNRTYNQKTNLQNHDTIPTANTTGVFLSSTRGYRHGGIRPPRHPPKARSERQSMPREHASP